MIIIRKSIAIHSHLRIVDSEEDSPMYVCICNAIREKDLRTAARCCGGNAESVYAALGHTPQCCQCLEEAEDIIADETMTSGALSAAA